ncbi:MAG: hypothetical protein ACK50N_01305 [Flavobacteriales bacterium]
MESDPLLAAVCAQVDQALATTKIRLEKKDKRSIPLPTTKAARPDPKQRVRAKSHAENRKDLLSLFERLVDPTNEEFAKQREHLVSALPLSLPSEPSIIGVGLSMLELPRPLQDIFKKAEGLRRRTVPPTSLPTQTPTKKVQTTFLANVKKAKVKQQKINKEKTKNTPKEKQKEKSKKKEKEKIEEKGHKQKKKHKEKGTKQVTRKRKRTTEVQQKERTTHVSQPSEQKKQKIESRKEKFDPPWPPLPNSHSAKPSLPATRSAEADPPWPPLPNSHSAKASLPKSAQPPLGNPRKRSAPFGLVSTATDPGSFRKLVQNPHFALFLLT